MAHTRVKLEATVITTRSLPTMSSVTLFCADWLESYYNSPSR